MSVYDFNKTTRNLLGGMGWESGVQVAIFADSKCRKLDSYVIEALAKRAKRVFELPKNAEKRENGGLVVMGSLDGRRPPVFAIYTNSKQELERGS